MNEITLFELAQAFHEGTLSFREYLRMLTFYRQLPDYAKNAAVEEGL
jgi:hypothetical protein